MASMHLLKDATDAIQRNLGLLAAYTGVTLVAGGLLMAWRIALDFEWVPLETPWRQAATLAIGMVVIVPYAAAQAVLLSRFGQDIDRPLWKVSGNRDALTRFFGLWYTLSLIPLVTRVGADYVGAVWAEAAMGVLLTLLLAYFLLGIFLVPVGAAIMFFGRAEWRLVPEALAPLGRQFPGTLILLMPGIVQFILFECIQDPERNLPLALVSAAAVYVIVSYLDCFAFAATWVLCIVDRETPEEQDFDF